MKGINKYKDLMKSYKRIIQIFIIVLLIVASIPIIKVNADDTNTTSGSNETINEVTTKEEGNEDSSDGSSIEVSNEETTTENIDQNSIETSVEETTEIKSPPVINTTSETEGRSEIPEPTWRVYEQDGERILEILPGMLEDMGVNNIPWSAYTTDITKIIIQPGAIAPENASNMFANLENVTEIIGIENLNMTAVKDASLMFANMDKLTTLDLTSWNTSNIEIMTGMFSNTPNLKSLDVSNWNTDNVTTINYLFNESSALTTLNLANWNTENITNMYQVFAGASSLQSLDISGWKTQSNCNVLCANQSFANTTNLKEITVGPDFKFYTTSKLPDITSPGYTGRWIGLNTGKIFASSTDFITNYAGEADTYVWEEDSLDSGYHGTWWRIYDTQEDRILEISSGELNDFNSVPWRNYKTSITKVIIQDNVIAPVIAYGMFQDLEKLTEIIGIENLKVDQVEDARHMFSKTLNLKSLDLSSWNTENITDMEFMFFSTGLSTLNIENWNVEKVQFMQEMFSNSSQLTSLDLSQWNPKEVLSMKQMFDSSSIVSLNLAGWNVEKLKSTEYMFNRATNLKNLNISGWKTDSLVWANSMFENATSIETLDLANWNTERLYSINGMFMNMTNLKSLNLTNWDVSTVYDFSYLFYNTNNLASLDLTGWNTNSQSGVIQAIDGMFNNMYSLSKLTISEGFKFNKSGLPAITSSDYTGRWIGLYTGTVFNSSDDFMNNYSGQADTYIWEPKSVEMGFDGSWWRVYDTPEDRYLELFTGNLKEFGSSDSLPWKNYTYSITKVTLQEDILGPVNMGYLFSGLDKVTSIEGLENIDISQVTNMEYLFHENRALEALDLSFWNIEKVENMQFMFNGDMELSSLNLEGWNPMNVRSMKMMFYNCRKLIELDLSDWNVSRVKNLERTFAFMPTLKTLILKNWNLNSIESIDDIFRENENIETLDLSNWNVEKVTNMNSLFRGHKNLTSLNLTGWNPKAVTNMDGIFYQVSSLESLDLSGWNVSNVDSMYYAFGDMTSLKSLNLSGWDLKDNVDITAIFINTTALDQLTLGANFIMNDTVELPTITANRYSGGWIGLNTGTVFSSSATFASNYAGEADTYVWQKEILSVTIPVSMLFTSDEVTPTTIVSPEYDITNNTNSKVKVELTSLVNPTNIAEIEDLKLNAIPLIKNGVSIFNDATDLFELEKEASKTLKFSGESQLVEKEVNPKFNLTFKFGFTE